MTHRLTETSENSEGIHDNAFEGNSMENEESVFLT